MENFLAFLGRFWEILARRVDSFLMAAALAIVGVGLVTLFSASDQSIARVTSQALSLGFALVLMWIVANVAPQQLSRAALPEYVLLCVRQGPRADRSRRSHFRTPNPGAPSFRSVSNLTTFFSCGRSCRNGRRATIA